MNPAVIKAFWHRTRNKPLPWTSQEIANRLGIPLADAIDALCTHAQLGITKAERTEKRAPQSGRSPRWARRQWPI